MSLFSNSKLYCTNKEIKWIAAGFDKNTHQVSTLNNIDHVVAKLISLLSIYKIWNKDDLSINLFNTFSFY